MLKCNNWTDENHGIAEKNHKNWHNTSTACRSGCHPDEQVPRLKCNHWMVESHGIAQKIITRTGATNQLRACSDQQVPPLQLIQQAVNEKVLK
jgi:hypothetical protein